MVKSVVCEEILEGLRNGLVKDKVDLNKLKLTVVRKYKGKFPTNADVAACASVEDLKLFGKLLSIKPIRTLSGVAPVAVMSKPKKCPHGACIMCPSNVDCNIPQSYTGKEPATRRAIRNKFDPYLQVFNRLEQYVAIGHCPEKVELIVMGGTFPSFPKKYQKDFVMFCLKAMNDFSKLFFKNGMVDIVKFNKFFELPGNISSDERVKSIQKRVLFLKKKGKASLSKEQDNNEMSVIKCVGLTVETRPDYGMLEHGNFLLELGTTRVELGVQSVYDDILERIERGHTVQDTINSIRILKDLGFKINAHYMPGLPGVDKKRDLMGMRMLFETPLFQPDMLKIYPCMVVPNSKLYKIWKKGKFKPLTTAKAAKLIAEFKKFVPEYVRIMRVQRDIPTYMTSAGVGMTNLRQYIFENLNPKCRCIRCREIGRSDGKVEDYELKTQFYYASHGHEFFISAEAGDSIIGFCRLRFPSQSLRKEITNDSALIRELHVYGVSTPVGEKGDVQHLGVGKSLLGEAERIARTYYKKKIVVISGVGVRGYYKKFGYKRQGPYMVKRL